MDRPLKKIIAIAALLLAAVGFLTESSALAYSLGPVTLPIVSAPAPDNSLLDRVVEGPLEVAKALVEVFSANKPLPPRALLDSSAGVVALTPEMEARLRAGLSPGIIVLLTSNSALETSPLEPSPVDNVVP